MVPVSGLVVLAVIVIWSLARRTDWGVALYAIGEDEQAARLSGVPVARARFLTFVGAGMLYGLAVICSRRRPRPATPMPGRHC
ncbi:hypothetical protein [Gemmobacter sp. 24YEA27]|uniref:ABC transporter permease subunit n=1 Tax=Gemmobacter sp. 24YEA27 TaxID=3040672 RepID=UPI0024B33C4A|nr:hypothetical protein [Gemmobacter sp. 24YEA27]